jgi:glycosyltransferase involved in cell wall biosynthesis
MAEEKLNVLMVGPTMEVKGGITSVVKVILSKEIEGIALQHVGTYTDTRAINKLPFFLKRFGEIRRQVAASRPDLVHIHFSSHGSFFRKSTLGAYFRRQGIPYIAHCHSSSLREFYAKLPQVFKRRTQRFLMNSAAVVVLSDSWEQYFVETLGIPKSKLIVLPNPVILPASVPQRDYGADTLNLLFLGLLGQRKGCYVLVEAMAQAVAKLGHRRLRLRMAGNGEIDKLRALAQERGVAELIHITDWLRGGELQEAFEQAHAFVLPSYNEGLPMAILEALGWGLPVVSTPVGGIPEVIRTGENGLLVPPGDAEALSEALCQLALAGEPLAQLSRNARASVEPFRSERYLQTLGEIYHQIARRQPATPTHSAV